MDLYNPLEIAKKFAITIEALTDVLELESDRVYSASETDLKSYLTEKTRLLADYASDMELLKTASKRSNEKLPEEIRIKLKTQSMRLVQAMDRNRRALEIAHSASETVVSAIIDAVKKQRQETSGYSVGKQGLTMGYPAMRAAQAVTLDERL